MKVLVMHSSYGCETGCCGHVILVGDDDKLFTFDHPFGQDPRQWAEELITEELGPGHVADLDWKNSVVFDD